ncbi:hypothetical protein [Comamonas thiooxydans]|uniref:hypothetical protein n=1 Tax=Comamonas thiooxydans TaxID=363952 RepID=UPI0031201470
MKISSTLSIVAIACVLAACGGGGGGDSSSGGGSNNNGGSTPPAEVIPPSNSAYPTAIEKSTYTEKDKVDIYSTINNFRTTCGFSSIKQNSLLDTAANGHAVYLQSNNANGHTQNSGNINFTGANLLNRANAAGYQPSLLGEIVGVDSGGSLLAGTSPSGINTSNVAPTGQALIKSLFSSVYHLSAATKEWVEMGVGYSASGNLTSLPGETVFYAATVVNFGVASGSNAPAYTGGKIRSFPCEGTDGVYPIFTSETPNPYPGRDFNASPMGTPIMLTSGAGGSIEISKATITAVGASTSVAVKILNSADDVHKLVANSEAFAIPDLPLAEDTSYSVAISGTADAKPFTTSFTFKTGKQN